MNDNASLTFHHHWLHYWRPLAVCALLLVLAVAGLLVWLPAGLVFLAAAALDAGGIYLFWTWHTLTFTDGNRLVRRRGILGSTKDVITLFGVISPNQVPILGKLLNVGSVHLGIPGPNIHIRYIAGFDDFCARLLCGGQQQQQAAQPPVIQVFFQMPPPYMTGRRRDQLGPG